jgi:hypothetical protein
VRLFYHRRVEYPWLMEDRVEHCCSGSSDWTYDASLGEVDGKVVLRVEVEHDSSSTYLEHVALELTFCPSCGARTEFIEGDR